MGQSFNSSFLVCGIRKENERIVGGLEAGVNEFPWMAHLSLILHSKEEFHVCGGALQSKPAACTTTQLRSKLNTPVKEERP